VSDGADIERVLVPGLSKPKYAYAHAVVHNGIVYCSGQLGIDPTTGALVEGVAAQTTQALRNLDVVLTGASSSLKRVLQARVYLRDQASFQEMDGAYAAIFADALPARTTLPGIGFGVGTEVEIDVTAAAIIG
jgi:2-iminobutanoate/2-iminopropanoate deaminase